MIKNERHSHAAKMLARARELYEVYRYKLKLVRGYRAEIIDCRYMMNKLRKDIEGYDEYRFYNYCYLSERGKFIIPSELKERLKKIIEVILSSLWRKVLENICPLLTTLSVLNVSMKG